MRRKKMPFVEAVNKMSSPIALETVSCGLELETASLERAQRRPCPL
jgi:hypothetical protein